MNLETWIDKAQDNAKKAGAPLTRKAVIMALAEQAGVAYSSIAPVERGARMGLYKKALAVSEATGWEVNVLELCDPDPATRLTQILSQAEQET